MTNKKNRQTKPTPAPAPEATPPGAWWETLWAGALLSAIAALLAYHGVVSNDFVFFDDDKAILYNQALQAPGLSSFFSGQNLGMYAPLTWMSYWAGKSLSGQDPWGYHLISLMVHTLNAVLVFLLVRMLLNRHWPALFTALLFAVHPVQAEAVGWAAAMSTLLFAFFYLLSLLTYVHWNQTRRPAWYLGALLLFLLSCLSKSAAVTLPLVLVAIDVFSIKKQSGNLWLSKIPFFLGSLLFGLYTFSTRAQEGHDIDSASAVFSAADRFWMVCQTLLFYPVKLLFPFGFSIAYPFVKADGMWPWTYYAAPVALLLLGWMIWKWWRNRPEHLLAIALYLLPLCVMLPFKTVGSFELRSDRYVYLSAAGIFLLAALLLEKVSPPIRAGVLATAVLLLGFLGYQQSKVWSDGIALFENCVDKTPGAALCQCNLAYNQLVRMDFQGATRHYSETLRLDPTYVEAYNGRGQAYFQLKQISPALEDFTMAINAGLSSPKLFLNRGKCLVMLNRPGEAIPDLDKSLQLEPRAPEAYFFRGFAHERTGNLSQAIADYGTAIDQKGDYIEALVNRGLLLANQQQYDAALADYSRAIELNPNLAMALNNRASVYINQGNTNAALADLNRAIQVNPGYLRAYETRANLYRSMGLTTEANADLEQVARLKAQ